MKLSIIIPVYNEKRTIGRMIEKVKNIPIEKEMIIVDDGSTDGSREIIEKYKDEEDIKIVLKEKNEGKGSAIRKGMKYVNGDIVVIQDADMEYEPMNILKMVKVMEKNRNINALYGSRFLNKKNKFIFVSFLANRFITFLINILYFEKLTDIETCYKMIKSDIFCSLPLKTNGFEIEVEITINLLKRNIKIVEYPIDYTARRTFQGKKIKWKDGITTLFYILKSRFVLRKNEKK